MGMSVKRCQREVDSAEFSEWQAFDRVEPIGQRRDDINAALIRKTIAASVSKKGARLKLKSFLMDWWEDDKAQSPEDHRIVFDAFFHAMKQCSKPEPAKIGDT